MRLLIAAIADRAVVEPGDKLSVTGVFDTVFATAFPAVYPQAFLAFRLVLEYEDNSASKHRLSAVGIDQDGHEFMRVDTDIEISGINPGERATVNQVTALQQMAFRQPEHFSILVTWDGAEVQRIPFDVVQRP